uniref:Uncharacterized protein n=1 Tax=Lygus hesperus TaxID=30085 RepID=A0A146LML3_LYGHE
MPSVQLAHQLALIAATTIVAFHDAIRAMVLATHLTVRHSTATEITTAMAATEVMMVAMVVGVVATALHNPAIILTHLRLLRHHTVLMVVANIDKPHSPYHHLHDHTKKALNHTKHIHK